MLSHFVTVQHGPNHLGENACPFSGNCRELKEDYDYVKKTKRCG